MALHSALSLTDEYERGGMEYGQKNGKLMAPICEAFNDWLHSMKNYPGASVRTMIDNKVAP